MRGPVAFMKVEVQNADVPRVPSAPQKLSDHDAAMKRAQSGAQGCGGRGGRGKRAAKVMLRRSIAVRAAAQSAPSASQFSRENPRVAREKNALSRVAVEELVHVGNVVGK